MSSRVAMVIGLLSALTLAASPHAEAKEGAKPPSYTVEGMFPEKAPDGWRLKEEGGDAGSGLNEKALIALAKSSNTDEDDVYVLEKLFTKDGASANVALIDIDADPDAFRSALDTEAAAKGWSVLPLGSPMRLMVVGGPEGVRSAAHDVMKEHVIYQLCELAAQRLRAAPRKTKEVQKSADRLLDAARAMAADAGIADAMVGLALHNEGRNLEMAAKRSRELVKQLKKQLKKATKVTGNKEEMFKKIESQAAANEKTSKEKLNACIPHLTKAIKSKSFPPKDRILFFTGRNLGSTLLQLNKNDSLDVAIEAMKKAVSAEAHSPKSSFIFGNRYDLACAYARTKDNDNALKWLEEAFKISQTALSKKELNGNYTHWGKDTDLDPLRHLPKFKELMAKYKPKDYKSPEEEKAEKDKAEKEEEEKKENEKKEAGAKDDGTSPEE